MSDNSTAPIDGEPAIAAAVEPVAPAETTAAKPMATEPAPAPAAVKRTMRKGAADPAKPAPAVPSAAEPAKVKSATRKPRATSARPAPAAKAPRLAKPRIKKPVASPAVKPIAATPKTSPTTTPLKTPKAARPKPTLPKSKDKIMAQNPIDFTAAFKTAFADFQDKAKAAYEKGTATFGEANEFAKGNVEALVESGKILASGLQELGTTLTTESRSAFETLTAEAKELAAVKSPTEFFQLQSNLLRKHFDAVVAQTSKSTEAVMKLANDAFTPISTRVTLAVEKVSKAA